MGVSVGLLTAAAVLLGRSQLPRLFSSDPAVIAAAATALPIVAFSMVCSLFLRVVSLLVMVKIALIFTHPMV